MTQKYTATKMFEGEGERELQVQSSKCLYYVWLNEEEATLRGPGVRESGSFPRIAGKIDDEDFAIFVVLLFENGLWPED